MPGRRQDRTRRGTCAPRTSWCTRWPWTGGSPPGIWPAPDEPGLVITFTQDEPPSYPALLRAAACGLVEPDGRRELLERFISVFTPPKDARPAGQRASGVH
jgi:hypothetical protein